MYICRWYNTRVAYLSGVIFRRREEVQKMTDILVHIMTTAASGCIVTFFEYWLRKRDDK
ncbi:hypothetical protein M452_0203705 [Staphylococcus epidermidis APO35]|nr:hypothetical protein M462_0210140 [Staphylococcus epidermidis CIM28]ESR27088.1 hypothetical protein M452_0203705 [Staphylococcus epidermidis APO35]ESU02776.1 hypothetical protein M461_0212095 [Staphylococcus epidermidis CIM37]ESV11076.1 hypothetical protein M456_0200465 [Staphylococcus epidermidis MC28]ESV14145.1 hypothetical protein M463_0209130 [Staphylococcus epidermidis WI05]ESV19619.1 hypothetical protein M464_0207090 [Staphylococcus epidermidis WI09]ESV25483.1 hypothetical protein M4